MLISSVFSQEAVNPISQPSSDSGEVSLLNNPDQVLAKVGTAEITVKDISELYQEQLRQMKKQGMTISPMIHDYIVTGLISRKIEEIFMLAEAKKKDISIDPLKPEEYLGKLKSKFKTEDDFKVYLQEKKLTEEQVKEKIRERLLINAFQEDLFKSVTVTDEEAAVFFNQNEKRINPPESWKISQIMKRFSDDSAADIEKTKESLSLLRKEIIEKKLSFDKTAQMHSQGATAVQGGLIGWVTAETPLEPELFNAIKTLKKGDISPVVVLKNSVQLIRIEDYVPVSEKKTFDSVKSEIKDSLKLEKKKAVLTELMEKCKTETCVEILYKSTLSS